MKKILFPTDFSETAKNGFRYAIALANDLEAELDIMTVFSIPMPEPDTVMPAQFEILLAQRRKVIKGKLDEFIASVTSDFVGKRVTVYGAFIPEEISDQVNTNRYNLVIMGTKGERNVLEKLIGSITTRTMMNSSCPVLAVPKDAKYKGIDYIAYASNFIPTDNVALGKLMNFSRKVNAKLNFVHVDTIPNIGEIEDDVSLNNYPSEFTEFSIINNTSVVKGLDDYIEQKGIDILALFIPKRRLWERLYHSSFSKKYAFHTKIPLLIFRE